MVRGSKFGSVFLSTTNSEPPIAIVDQGVGNKDK